MRKKKEIYERPNSGINNESNDVEIRQRIYHIMKCAIKIKLNKILIADIEVRLKQTHTYDPREMQTVRKRQRDEPEISNQILFNSFILEQKILFNHYHI